MMRQTLELQARTPERPTTPAPTSEREDAFRENLLRAVEKAKTLFRDPDIPVPESASLAERGAVIKYQQARDRLFGKLRVLFFAVNAYAGAGTLSDAALGQISPMDMLEMMETEVTDPGAKSPKKQKELGRSKKERN